ncbi:MAG: elongation factor P maturation arginine rhamnosyltransferase EarP [Burkholderiaceae bacterium]|nr:elongation factor P maturation arginine rhamnosyltransferase EarP [Burkholderiaceae bacterium]
MLWDIYCRVIDNFGDIGVCWRLSCDLAARGERVRLWLDDAAALGWLAPQGRAGVEVLSWPGDSTAAEPGHVVIEAFGCELPEPVQAAMARSAGAGKPVCWINLEYLTAEAFAERAHGLPSPVMSGPAAGQVKYFFYPGFTAGTGGLLREPDLITRQAAFNRADWLARQGIAWHGERLVSLFCYEPAALAALLNQLSNSTQPALMLVTPGRATRAVQSIGWPDAQGALALCKLQALPQTGYDELLWACDLNFVRGEDSLVRALWAGKPLVWQAYPQDDGAHHTKLEALLSAIAAPDSLRQAHRVWNGLQPGPLPLLDLARWGVAVRQARDALWLQDDLTTQLVRFASKKR